MFLDSSENRIISRQYGFTLIEVMVSLVIFVIAIIGCYRLQFASSFSNIRSNNVANASTWAQYMAEDLLAREYKDNNNTKTDPLLLHSVSTDVNAATAATADGVRYVGINGSVNTVAAPSDLYSIFWNIVDNQPLKNVKQIRIIVVKNGGASSGRLYTQDYFKLGPLN